MGTLYTVVNITKKQYISAWLCDSGAKLGEMSATPSYQKILTYTMLHHWLSVDEAQEIVLLPDYSENYDLVKEKYEDVTIEVIKNYNSEIIQYLVHLDNDQTTGKWNWRLDNIVLPSEWHLKERAKIIGYMDDFLKSCIESYFHREMMDELRQSMEWNIAIEIQKELSDQRFKEVWGVTKIEFMNGIRPKPCRRR